MDVSYVSELSSDEISRRQFTTLDLCAPDSFTIIVTSSALWTERLQEVRSQYAQSGPKIALYALGADFDVIPGPRGNAWIDGADLKAGGGLLVRPDQHIQMRLEAGTSAEAILSSLKSHLGK